MRILIIGGTRFIGPYIVRELVQHGHSVTLLHRGQTTAPLPPGVSEMFGDQRKLEDCRAEFQRLAPDVVLHTNAFCEDDARIFVRTFAGIARRSIVLSSIDVYRAYGRLHRTEPGPPDPTPLTEDSPLRERPSIHGAGREKLDVEQVFMSERDLPSTILRLPAVYGPGDHMRRFRDYLIRMFDGRPVILMEDGYAAWRWSHGYVENVAAAIALAVTDNQAVSRIYNVGEADVPTEAERVRAIGFAADWRGEIIAMPRSHLPTHLQDNVDWSQPWTVDTKRIRNELGFEERVTVEAALRRTIAWHMTHIAANATEQRPDYAAEDAARQQHREA
jgi:nucleoside-diphosphate-sugar epimerase